MGNTLQKSDYSLALALCLLSASTLLSWKIQSIVAVLFCLFSLVYFLVKREKGSTKKLNLLFLAYFLVHAISLLWAEDREYGINIVNRYLPFLLFTFAFLGFKIKRDQFLFVLKNFVHACLIFCFISIGTWLYKSNELGIPIGEWFVTHKSVFLGWMTPYHIVYAWTDGWHPSYCSIGYSMGVGIGLYLMKIKANKWINIELAVLLALSLLLSFITQSRIGLVMLFVVFSLGILYLYVPKNRWTMGTVGVIGIFLATLLFFKLSNQPIGNDIDRLQQYEIAYTSIQASPLLGTGVGGMQAPLHEAGMRYNYPHNQFIGDLMQTGWLGFSTLMLLFVYVGILAWRGDFLLFVLLCTYVPLCLVEMPLNITQGIIPFLVFSSLFVSQTKEITNKPCATTAQLGTE